jgi:hypothetical protein
VPPTTAAYTATTTSSSAVPSHQQSQVPPNAPPGGQWVMKKHIGQTTRMTCAIVSVITCCFCLFPCGVWALLCPCDKKLACVSQGKACDQQGRILGPAQRHKTNECATERALGTKDQGINFIQKLRPELGLKPDKRTQRCFSLSCCCCDMECKKFKLFKVFFVLNFSLSL